jgi:hypothetical protein
VNHIASHPGEDGEGLLIEVVFDLVCPWCYLGVARLMRMLDHRPEVVVAIQWRPFLLNPDIAPGGVPRQDYMVRKFGGEDRARRLHGSITELGRAEGLAFRFDAIRRVPHSLDAHRMVRWAAGHGARAPGRGWPWGAGGAGWPAEPSAQLHSGWRGRDSAPVRCRPGPPHHLHVLLCQ